MGVQFVHSRGMNSDALLPVGYGDFLVEVKAQIRQRQLSALRAVNTELIGLYWWIGQSISQRQAKLGWGKAVVQTLANDLQTEFPGRNGFSAQNLWAMRQFFNEYNDKPKLQPLVGEISWSKNLLILAHCKDDLEREFYLRATARFGWTTTITLSCAMQTIAQALGRALLKLLTVVFGLWCLYLSYDKTPLGEFEIVGKACFWSWFAAAVSLLVMTPFYYLDKHLQMNDASNGWYWGAGARIVSLCLLASAIASCLSLLAFGITLPAFLLVQSYVIIRPFL